MRVTATRSNADDGLPSGEVAGTPKAAPPEQVSGVIVTEGAGRLTVSWDVATDAGGYKVQWKSGAESFNETDSPERAQGQERNHLHDKGSDRGHHVQGEGDSDQDQRR